MDKEGLDPFINMLERLIAELEEERSEWARVRAEAEEHLAEIARELDNLRGVMIKYKRRRGLGLSRPRVEAEASSWRSEEFSDVPLAEACVKVLTEAGRPMRAADIVEEVQRRGGRTNSATPYNVIVTAMRRDKRLINLDRGLWGLAGRDNSQY